MTEFNRQKFEGWMSEAVRLHNEGHYEDALQRSTYAYEAAPEQSFEKGRAARDNAARCDRLGRPDDATVWAGKAFRVHDDIVNDMALPTREAFRERFASAIYAGAITLRKVIDANLAGQNTYHYPEVALHYVREYGPDIGFAKAMAPIGINRFIDQYEINASRRASIIESLAGERRLGFMFGSLAVSSAFMSESPRLDTSNPTLSTRDRLRAKAKALSGSLAAVGVAILASPKVGYRQKLAHKLAKRSL